MFPFSTLRLGVLMKQIPISKILNLTNKNKFEVTCATFDAVDHIFKLEITKSLKGRKSAVQVMTLLAGGHIQYGYDKPAIQEASEEEAEAEVETDSSL